MESKILDIMKKVGITFMVFAIPMILLAISILMRNERLWMTVFQVIGFVLIVILLYFLQQEFNNYSKYITNFDYDSVWIIIVFLLAIGILLQILIVIYTRTWTVSPDFIYPLIMTIVYLPIYFVLKYNKDKLSFVLGSLWGGISFIVSLLFAFQSAFNDEPNAIFGLLYVVLAYGLIIFSVLSIVFLSENVTYGIDKLANFLIL
jgi:hypothetical protein